MQYLAKVLLVEDDRSMAGALAHALQSSYDLEITNNGKLALYKADTQHFDLIILDLNLPDMSGMVVCQHLRNRGLTAPILILSGENQTLTKINLLDAGANDYLTKPFSLGELKARLRALVRIKQGVQQSWGALSASGINLNRQTYEVSRDGVAIQLRRKEFALLECLLENAGNVVTRDMLTRVVWQNSDDLWANTVAVHIKYLRDKVDRPFETPLIKTVHGRGYRLEATQPVLVGQN
jgi:two-component system OmpR family response regulator